MTNPTGTPDPPVEQCPRCNGTGVISKRAARTPIRGVVSEFQCRFCRASMPEDLSKASREGWDWFTGISGSRQECCFACQEAHRGEWRAFINENGGSV